MEELFLAAALLFVALAVYALVKTVMKFIAQKGR